jgi:hypothetical protein
MKTTQVFVKGILKPDGSLELKEIPQLPPGPVELLIRTTSETAENETWWEFLERGRAELLAQGYTFRTKEEIDADLAQRKEREAARRQSIERAHSPQE